MNWRIRGFVFLMWWSLAWFPYFYSDCPWPYCVYRILPSIWTLSKYPDSLKHWYKKMLINILSNFCKVVSKWVTELKKTSSLSNCPVVMGNFCSWGSSNVAQWFMKNWAGFIPRAKNLWIRGLSLVQCGGSYQIYLVNRVIELCSHLCWVIISHFKTFHFVWSHLESSKSLVLEDRRYIDAIYYDSEVSTQRENTILAFGLPCVQIGRPSKCKP